MNIISHPYLISICPNSTAGFRFNHTMRTVNIGMSIGQYFTII